MISANLRIRALRFIFISVLLATAQALTAQAAPAPAFEVATIKPSDPDKRDNSLYLSDGKFVAQRQTLTTLIKFAYGLNTGSDQQASGGPKWLDSVKYDLNAKEDEKTAAALKAMSRLESTKQVRLMLQALLAERFGLKVHHESKILPVFAMVVAKGGSKMSPFTLTQSNTEPKMAETWGGVRQAGRGELEGHNVTMDVFSEVIAHQPEMSGRMVVDQTGLTGKYNFMLKWTPESGAGDLRRRERFDRALIPDRAAGATWTQARVNPCAGRHRCRGRCHPPNIELATDSPLLLPALTLRLRTSDRHEKSILPPRTVSALLRHLRAWHHSWCLQPDAPALVCHSSNAADHALL